MENALGEHARMDEHVLVPWQNFYVALSSASAAMLGLLFVGLSLHLRMVIARPEIRALTRQTFLNFCSLSLLSLAMLVPSRTMRWQGVCLMASGLINLVSVAPRTWQALRAPDSKLPQRLMLARFAGSASAYLALLWAGYTLLSGIADGLHWVMGAVIWLLMGCLRNVWELLVSVGELSIRHQTKIEAPSKDLDHAASGLTSDVSAASSSGRSS